ncbi:hypothetical protein [Hydrocarboniphaga effusa]|uniref:hypothetical protein n=1 Tax=Hydrocarboniphaga effusa TaxID=243629 RepID=UPI0031383D52
MKSTIARIAVWSTLVPAAAQAHPGHERLETDASSNAVFGIVQLLENGHPALWLLLVLSVVAAVRLGMKAPSPAA